MKNSFFLAKKYTVRNFRNSISENYSLFEILGNILKLYSAIIFSVRIFRVFELLGKLPYIVFNNPMKKKLSGSKGPYVQNFTSFFPKFTPTHSRSVYDPTGMSLAIHIGRCPICFLQNISQTGQVVLEKKSFEWFLPYMAMTATLNFGS